jgi:hypothetical protein
MVGASTPGQLDVSREIHGLRLQGESERNGAEQDYETAHGEGWLHVRKVRIRIRLLW